MTSFDADVLVVGAGPVGLMLAAEMARHGIRVRIIDSLAAPSPYCRAIGVTTRTLEIWDDMGIVREMIDAGAWIRGSRTIIHGQTQDAAIDLSDLPYEHLGLPQNETERVLTRHLATHGLQIERRVTLESLSQTGQRVHVSLLLPDGRREDQSYRYVVGCDGAHSIVRKSLQIDFNGDSFPFSFMLGDVQIVGDLPHGVVIRALRPSETGPPDMFLAVPLPMPGRYRVSAFAPAEKSSAAQGTEHGFQPERTAPTIDDLQIVADRLMPSPVTLSDLRWSSNYRISMRLASSYRVSNVFIAGDAAHIHPPTGGQGMNTGLQDAYNLAWKLALVIKQLAPLSLLDSYEAERRPIGQQVIAATTAASVRLGRGASDHSDAARLADTQVLVNYRESALVHTDADVDQARGPLAGDRMPDAHGLVRQGVGYPLRLHDLLRGPEHILLAYESGASFETTTAELTAVTPALDVTLLRRVLILSADSRHRGSYPIACYHDSLAKISTLLGPGPVCCLIRPDGYLAWRGTTFRSPRLKEVLSKTFVQENHESL